MIISISNHKGGQGKTTLTLNIGAGLAARGKRVLIVDADAQGTLTEACGFPHEPGLYNVLVRDTDWAEAVRVVPPAFYGGEGWLGLLPGNNETRHIAESISTASAVLDKFGDLSGRLDYVLFDMSPTESLLHPLVYIASDAVLHPVVPEDWALRSLARTVKYVENAQVYRTGAGMAATRRLAVCPVMLRETSLHAVMLQQLAQTYGALARPVRQRIAWSEAAAMRQPIFVYAPDSEAAAELWELVDIVEGEG